jgi:hypothetical protein
MVWIKRNLFFVIGAVVALALLLFAGYYNFTGWKHKVEEGEKLNGKYEELKRLNNQNPHPGFAKVDNIKLARDQQKEIRDVLGRTAKYFQAPPAIPPSTNINSSQFSAALRETINQLSREAAGVSVQLPPDFKFSFSQQLRLLTFAPGSLEPLAVQLGEVKALCDVLIKAKVNSLDSIQRSRVSPDDEAGPQTDYIPLASTTNDLAVVSPYQITFRSFSHEIAQVLAGFANSPRGFIVRGINVEPAPATASEPPGTAPGRAATYAPVAPPVAASRPVPGYAVPSPGSLPVPVIPPSNPSPAPGYLPPGARGGGQTVLNEKQLRVTLLVQVVKLLPKK